MRCGQPDPAEKAKKPSCPPRAVARELTVEVHSGASCASATARVASSAANSSTASSWTEMSEDKPASGGLWSWCGPEAADATSGDGRRERRRPQATIPSTTATGTLPPALSRPEDPGVRCCGRSGSGRGERLLALARGAADDH